MAREQEMAKTNGKQDVSVGKAIISLLLVAVIAAGVCCMGYASRGDDGKWFGNFTDFNSWHWYDKEEIPGGAVIGGNNGDGINFLSTRILPETFAEHGISEQADSAYTITATILPSNATEKTLVWNLSWKDASSDFASGKAVTDYVTISVSENTLNATLVCLQPFGEQISLVANVSDLTNVQGRCDIDYKQRNNGTTFNLSFLDGTHYGTDYTYINTELSSSVNVINFPHKTDPNVGWHTNDNYKVKGSPSYHLELSETYTIPYVVEEVSFKTYVKLNDAFYTKLNQKNATKFNVDNTAAAWKLFDDSLVTEETEDFYYKSTTAYFVTDFFKILSANIVGNIYNPNVYCFQNDYSDFITVAQEIYDDVTHLFQIKVETTINGEVRENVYDITANREYLSVSASSVSMSTWQIVF